MKKSKKKPMAKKAASRSVSKTSVSNKSGVMPLGDRVLVKPLTVEEKTTAFGIIIPDTASKEKPEQGTVVAVGPGKRGEDGKVQPVGVSVGDKVLFSKYGYDEVKVNGTEYYIIAENNILAVLN